MRFRSPIVCLVVCSIVALLGMLPICALRLIVKRSFGKSWSATGIDSVCSHLVKVMFVLYHLFRSEIYFPPSLFNTLVFLLFLYQIICFIFCMAFVLSLNCTLVGFSTNIYTYGTALIICAHKGDFLILPH